MLFSLVYLFITLMACTSQGSPAFFAKPTDSGIDSNDSAVVVSGSIQDTDAFEGGETGETANSGSSGVGACREGMPFIDTMPDICFTPYEVSIVSGDLGDKDCLAPGAKQPSEVVIISEAGQVPATAVSFLQARAICEQQGVGWHLMTPEEFAAAGDGAPGEATTNYPYGDVYDATACNTEGSQSSDLALTGSYPKCVSVSGGWDFIGNAWTWTDPQKTILSATKVLEGMSARGIGIVLDTANRVIVGEADFINFQFLATGAGGVGVERSRAADGAYTITFPDDRSWDWGASYPRGYLVYDDTFLGGEAEADVTNDLVVEVVPDSPPSASGFSAHLEPYNGMEGYPMAGKQGGSTYTGSETLREITLEHLADFDGTIGFMCAVWTVY